MISSKNTGTPKPSKKKDQNFQEVMQRKTRKSQSRESVRTPFESRILKKLFLENRVDIQEH
ncbi:hypothetical protein OIU79_031007 [Salix purpurea]|uniref:Uncharacterized protein n=1 Tax=Salix purpurea TaxID=77065 RepID=A0A9Q0VBW2_SALPP|nr:hypothetical protein OIU79_031007 [Salix purpurea]